MCINTGCTSFESSKTEKRHIINTSEITQPADSQNVTSHLKWPLIDF